jgi:hypothetical protein
MFDWYRKLRIAIAPAVAYEDLLKVINWMGSSDTGLSSKAMAIQLSGAVVLRSSDKRGNYFSYPHDNGDLGRCICFLRYMGWEHRIKEMRGVSNEWTALVKHWVELTQLYDQEQAERDEWGGHPRPPRFLPKNASAKRREEYEVALALYNVTAGAKLYARMKEIIEPAEAKTRAAYERRQTRKAKKTGVKRVPTKTSDRQKLEASA